MRRSLLVALSAVAALGIVTAVVVAALRNNVRQPRPITAQAQPTATTQPLPAATRQPIPTCGSLNYAAGKLTTRTIAAQYSATCFASALSACHTATLNASVMSVDIGVTYHFSVSSACKATLDATVLDNTVTRTGTTTCQRVTDSATGLDFISCGTSRDIHFNTTQGAPPPNV